MSPLNCPLAWSTADHAARHGAALLTPAPANVLVCPCVGRAGRCPREGCCNARELMGSRPREGVAYGSPLSCPLGWRARCPHSHPCCTAVPANESHRSGALGRPGGGGL